LSAAGLALGVALLLAPKRDARAAGAELPVEASSTSEILAATHLFSVRLKAVSPRPWIAGADGLERRQLDLTLILEEPLKGRLITRAGERVQAQVEQVREGENQVSDSHGPWSDRNFAVGDGLLISASGEETSPVKLLQPPTLRAIYDIALAADVRGAKLAEARLAPGMRSRSRVEQTRRARELLARAGDPRSSFGELYGDYVWARLRAVYAANEAALAPAVAEIAVAPRLRPGLRQALVSGAYAAVLDLGWTPQRARTLVTPLLRYLPSSESLPLREWLVGAPLYNLIFPPGVPPLEATSVISSTAERKRVAAAVASVSSDRAARLSRWLNPP
jgi:hypothetical protein